MAKLLAALTLVLTSVGKAFGASAEFIFFNKLALLIVLAIIFGGLAALGGYVIAIHLRDALRRPQPVRVRTRHSQNLRRENRNADSKSGY